LVRLERGGGVSPGKKLSRGDWTNKQRRGKSHKSAGGEGETRGTGKRTRIQL